MIFLFPTEMEAARFRAAAPDAEIIICGVGLAECAATLAQIISSGRRERIILAGIAGSHNVETAPIGSVVEIIREETAGLPERFSRCYTNAAAFNLPTAASASVTICGSSAPRHETENMEGAALFAICARCETPCSEIRAISNMVGDEFDKWQIDRALEALTETLTSIR